MVLPYGSSTANIVNNINFIKDNVGWVAANSYGMYGKIFYTTDQGNNWQLISDEVGIVSELDNINIDTALVTFYGYGTVTHYGMAGITKNNFTYFSWLNEKIEWRKGIFINDTTVLFYGANNQNAFKMWTMHIDDGELSEIIDFPTIPMYFAAFRLPAIVFLHDSPYNIAKRIDTSYVNIPSGKIPQKELTVYPNPASNRLNIKVPDVVKRGKITITKQTGQVVFFAGIENNDEQIDITNFSAGVYLITVITDNKRFCGRFIKLKKTEP